MNLIIKLHQNIWDLRSVINRSAEKVFLPNPKENNHKDPRSIG